MITIKHNLIRNYLITKYHHRTFYFVPTCKKNHQQNIINLIASTYYNKNKDRLTPLMGTPLCITLKNFS